MKSNYQPLTNFGSGTITVTNNQTIKKQPELQSQFNFLNNSVARLGDALSRIRNFNDRMSGDSDGEKTETQDTSPSSFLSHNQSSLDRLQHLVGLLENEANKLEDLY